MALGISDELLGGILPIVAYWLHSGLYVVLDPYLDRYRIHTRNEEQTKNIATKLDVVKGALLEHMIQMVFVLFVFTLKGENGETTKQPSLPVAIVQILVAKFVLDTYLYFMHRAFHTNFLYKHIHSKHHKLIVTYPYGSQFNHPVEGFLLDTVGVVVAFLASGMTPKTAVFFYTLTTVKGVEDHCGFYIPWNPFHRLFGSNSVFHDVHHQLYGLKFNYGTPFFNIWDRLLGTYLSCELKMRRDGDGYEVVPFKKE